MSWSKDLLAASLGAVAAYEACAQAHVMGVLQNGAVAGLSALDADTLGQRYPSHFFVYHARTRALHYVIGPPCPPDVYKCDELKEPRVFLLPLLPPLGKPGSFVRDALRHIKSD